MQFLNYVLLQIDEACRHIRDGRLAQLRISLLLLDNAAEIQMKECIRKEVDCETMWESLRNKALEIPKEIRDEKLESLVQWEPLSWKYKNKIEKYFDEKISYLVKRAKMLNPQLASPLSYLHKYRNEAYHSVKVRKETVETAAKLLLDINCELLLALTKERSYSSNDDYSWLEERFGINPHSFFLNEGYLYDIVHQFRKNMNLDDNAVAQLLSDHLLSRIQGVFDDLDFLVINKVCNDRQAALQESIDYMINLDGQRRISKNIGEKLQNKNTLNYFNTLINRLDEISSITNKYKSFQRFFEIESEFEPVEKSIQEFASEIDCVIQMKIDMARGK